MSKEYYCNYCRMFKIDDGTSRKLSSSVGRGGTPTPRRMCTKCHELRLFPRAQLAEMAALEQIAKKKVI